ncbi:MAG: hypothetical protein F6K16_24605 [Symploca sp. SIO2B6]|nr:hypothetical protein [Symploca sp. SIO2B6]
MSKNKAGKDDYTNINTGNVGGDYAGRDSSKVVRDINNYKAGRDINQARRDNRNTTRINISLWVSLILIGVIALGAGAYFLRVRFNPTEGEINIDSPSNQEQLPPISKPQKGD